MIAWVKIYKPALFYASYFNFRTDAYELETMCKSSEEIDNRLMELFDDGEEDSELFETLSRASDMVKSGIKLINKNGQRRNKFMDQN